MRFGGGGRIKFVNLGNNCVGLHHRYVPFMMPVPKTRPQTNYTQLRSQEHITLNRFKLLVSSPDPKYVAASPNPKYVAAGDECGCSPGMAAEPIRFEVCDNCVYSSY